MNETIDVDFTEALESLQEVKEEEQKHLGFQRIKRQVFSKDEKKIAGVIK
jgi:hypothetical protein